MDWFEAFILGLIQGLTEFLPVSSSGHLELGKAILGIDVRDSLIFTVVVHAATVLSTIFVFYKGLWQLLKGLFLFRWNDETKYILKIIISMIPVAILGFFFKDIVEGFFREGNVVFVGCMLLITSLLLASTYLVKAGKKEISNKNAFIIGIAQAIAVLPGISRSGATIATGLLLGNKRVLVARFSFLMVLIPIIGENLIDLFSGEMISGSGIGVTPLMIGFVTAFVSGLIACKWMIGIVKKGKLIYFVIYCFLIGMSAIVYNIL